MITELKVFTTGLAGLPVWIGTPTVGCRAVKALLTIDAQAGDSILSDYIQRVFPETECAIPIDWNPEVRWTV